jgi:hypothetical protein
MMENCKINLSYEENLGIIQCRVSEEIIRIHDIARDLKDIDSELSLNVRLIADALAKAGNILYQYQQKGLSE